MLSDTHSHFPGLSLGHHDIVLPHQLLRNIGSCVRKTDAGEFFRSSVMRCTLQSAGVEIQSHRRVFAHGQYTGTQMCP